MPNATLIINQPGRAETSLDISEAVVSIGRAPDNTISLEGDSNVSRYHAEIEVRGTDFWIIDLGSSNGTTVNDAPLEFESPLRDGDHISIGGSTQIEFHQTQASNYLTPDASPEVDLPDASLDVPQVAAAAAAPAASGPSPVLIIAAVAGGLALVAIIAAVLLLTRGGSGCDATVRIVSPQSGTTVRDSVNVHVEVEGGKCIERVIYQLDGKEVASAETQPFDVVLETDALPSDLSSGRHEFSVVVEDEDGNKKLQEDSIMLAFDVGGGAGPTTGDTPPPVDGGTTTTNNQTNNAAASLSVVEVRELCVRLAKGFSSSKTEYKYDSEFLRQVQARTSEYALEGFNERARPFRDVINTSFIGAQGLDPPLGYVLAMSRSRFVLTKPRGATTTSADTSAEGLWQMTQAFAQSNGYNGLCGSETLADQSQRCAALVAASYSKAIVINLFEGDFLYSVACFGMAPKDAGEWRAKLPPDRSDFWKVINSPEQRERVVRFFAAGIVGENPQKFGLTKDRPLSSLYPKK
jgi:hypothetical protein